MNDFFRRQLTIYAGYHRDERNRVTHIFGIPMIFLAIVLPLSLWPVTVFGIPANVATVLAIPLVIVWILLDVAIGLAILAAIVPLLFIAAVIASHVSSIGVWLIAAVFSLSAGLCRSSDTRGSSTANRRFWTIRYTC
jgi:uncharacterized membrane protein YGL010W